MVNKIILCSDGTNNQGGFGRDTNVWRLYNLLQRNTTGSSVQHVHYDDGVGTEKSMPKKILGLAFGWGLSRNVRELYTYLASHYTPGDHIYLFGFSRGAYTVRQLANMVDFCGLPQWHASQSSPAELKEMVKVAENAYKTWCENELSFLGFNSRQYDPKPGARLTEQKDGLTEQGFQFDKVRSVYMGVWDTVNSTGAPIDEMRKFLPAWVQNKTVERLPECVRCGFHALAIDDERKAFDPTLWDESKLADDQYVEQVWFAGMHANIGGGYPKDGMAKVALKWMVSRLLVLDTLPSGVKNDQLLSFNSKLNELEHEASVSSKMHDSRSGLGAYYRYFPREVSRITRYSHGGENSALPRIHNSVFQRIRQKTNFYAPTNIADFIVASDQSPGSIEYSLSYESSDGKKASDISKEEVRLNVIGRKRLYRLFLCFTLLAALPPINQYLPERLRRFLDFSWATLDWNAIWGVHYIAKLFSLIMQLVPDFIAPILQWYGNHGWLLIIVAFVFIGLRQRKKTIETQQSETNNDIWHNLNYQLLEDIVSGHPSKKPSTLKKRGVTNLGKVSRVLRSWPQRRE